MFLVDAALREGRDCAAESCVRNRLQLVDTDVELKRSGCLKGTGLRRAAPVQPSALAFGVGHIYYMPRLLTWIPRWLPPSQMFWAYVTTIGFFLAAVAIISGIMAPIASRLITAEIVGFEILVWIPKLFAGPHHHFNWAGNALCIAFAGAP